MKSIEQSLRIELERKLEPERQSDRPTAPFPTILAHGVRLAFVGAAMLGGCKHVQPVTTEPSAQLRAANTPCVAAAQNGGFGNATSPLATGSITPPSPPVVITPPAGAANMGAGTPSSIDPVIPSNATIAPRAIPPAHDPNVVKTNPTSLDPRKDAPASDVKANPPNAARAARTTVNIPIGDGSPPSAGNPSPIDIDPGAKSDRHESAVHLPTQILPPSSPAAAKSSPASELCVPATPPYLAANPSEHQPVGIAIPGESANVQPHATVVHVMDRIILGVTDSKSNTTGSQSSFDKFSAAVSNPSPSSRPSLTSTPIDPNAPGVAPSSPPADPMVVPLPAPPSEDFQREQALRQRHLDSDRKAEENLDASLLRLILGSASQADSTPQKPTTRPTIRVFDPPQK